MNGYVEAGYIVVLGTLGTYGFTLAVRERATRRRVEGRSGRGNEPALEVFNRSDGPDPRSPSNLDRTVSGSST